MNLNKIINKKKKNLTHRSHGGEIYNGNTTDNFNSLIDFSTNINPLANPDIFANAYKKSIKQVPMYPDSNSTMLKKELVKYFEKKISEENLIVGAGSMELISLFCDMFINSNDEVIIVQPTFSEYEWAVQKKRGNVINVYRKPENYFRIDTKSIIDQIKLETRIIFLCNPNNPNGLLDNTKDIEEIIVVASKNDVFVFLDEAFIEFTGEINSFINKISKFDNLFISRSFTKFFGLTGLRIGFGVSSPEIINFISKGQILWSVNCIGQKVAQEILKSKKFIADSFNFFINERLFLKNELKKITGLKIFPSDTNYILINTEGTGIKSSKIKELLIKDNILIRDCSNYEGLDEFYIRISIKTRQLNLKLIHSLNECISLKN